MHVRKKLKEVPPCTLQVGAVMHVHGASPLPLLASKTLLGHAEPASGLLGVAYAMQAMHRQHLPPLMHLRTLNPYVVQQLQGNSLFMARLDAPLLATKAQQAVGVSAFAFQVCHVCAHSLRRSLATHHRAPTRMWCCRPPRVSTAQQLSSLVSRAAIATGPHPRCPRC